MLQLSKKDAIVYDGDELEHIKNIILDYAWEDQKNKTITIKNKISKHTLKKQECKCVYCEQQLIWLGPQIEHIADKSKYKQYGFEPLNLVIACAYCNGSSKKHDEDTVLYEHERYEKCEFKIVHPYLDNVKEHFVYLMDGQVVYDYKKCTPKGMFTIDTFGWDSYQYLLIFQRVQDQKNKPIPIDLEKLISEISGYKRKNN